MAAEGSQWQRTGRTRPKDREGIVVEDGFEAEEWELLLLAPWTVATGIVQADPSGSSGRRRELDALMDQIRMTQSTPQPSELVRSVAIELVGGRATPATRRVVDPDGQGDLRTRVLQRCGTVADLLETRVSPDESRAFKAWLLALAGAVAEAAREGDVLGIPGALVSDDEHAMLSDLARALRCDG
jgi:hypothetical protein